MSEMRDLTDLSQSKGYARKDEGGATRTSQHGDVKRSSHKTHMQLPFVAVLCVQGSKDIRRVEGPARHVYPFENGEFDLEIREFIIEFILPT